MDRNRQRFAQFPNIHVAIPSRYIVRRNLCNACSHSHGTSQNLNRGRSGRLRTGRSQPNNRRVRQFLVGTSYNQTRQLARRSNVYLPSTIFNRITRRDLGWYPSQYTTPGQYLICTYRYKSKIKKGLSLKVLLVWTDLLQWIRQYIGVNRSIHLMYSRNYSLHNSDMTENNVKCSSFFVYTLYIFSLQWVTHFLWFLTLFENCEYHIQWIDQQPSCKYVNKLKSGNLLGYLFWANQIAIVIIIRIMHLVEILQSDWLRANNQYLIPRLFWRKLHITKSILGWDVLIK